MRIQEYSTVQKLVSHLFSAGSVVDHYEENFSYLMQFIAVQPEISPVIEKYGAGTKDLERIFGFLLLELFQNRKVGGRYLPIEALITPIILDELLSLPMLEDSVAQRVHFFFCGQTAVSL